MPLDPDWKEFLELLNSYGVDYLVVGPHARGLYGIPRYTRDIDIFLRNSQANASKVESALVGPRYRRTGRSSSDIHQPPGFSQEQARRPKDLADLADLLE